MKLALPLLAALLAACTTVGPNYQRPAVELPQKFPVKTEGEAPLPPDWWTLYRDPVLDRLVAAARGRNADVAVAEGRVREAQAALREAAGALYPEVDAGYTATRSKASTRVVPFFSGIPLEHNTHTLIASASFEVDLWGQYDRATEAARAGLLASDFSLATTRLGVASATAQAYFLLRSYDAQIKVLDSSISVARDSLAIARERVRAGLAPALDADQAQEALSEALVQHREAVRNRALVVHQLGLLTGQSGLALPVASLPGELFSLPVPPAPPPGLPSRLLERRPDIRAAEESLVAANAQIGVARAALFPSIQLTGDLGAQSAELGKLLASGAGIWSIGAAIAAPIFDAGRRKALTEQAVARRDQAVGAYRRSIESGFREVSDALVNLSETTAEEQELLTQLEAARDALELSRQRYQSGYSAFLEVLDAQRAANNAELAYVRNRQARLAYSVDLMKALGGGWEAEPK